MYLRLQEANLGSEVLPPSTVTPTIASTSSRPARATQIDHGQGQTTIMTRPPPRSMLAATSNDQYQSHEVHVTLVEETELYVATLIQNNDEGNQPLPW